MAELSRESNPSFPNPPTEKNEGNECVVKEDKEFFIRKMFEQDPQRGLELLYKKYYLPLCSHAVRFVYSKEVAEDIVGDVFFAFFTREHYKNIRYTFQGYLFSAVRHNAVKYIRKEMNNVADEELEDINLPSTLPSPQQVMQYDELYFRIESIINKLPRQCRKIFILNRFGNNTYAKIAQKLNLSQKTVEAHMSKALKTLKEGLKDY